MKTKTKQAEIPGQRIVDRLVFENIQLIELRSKLGQLRKGELPPNAMQEMQVGYQVDNSTKKITVALLHRLVINYSDSPDGDPPIVIYCKFALHYGSAKVIASPNRLLKPLSGRAVRDSWSSWRELAQSLLVRMGLPPFTIPLEVPQATIQTDPKKAANVLA
jgi:hypothetical protein